MVHDSCRLDSQTEVGKGYWPGAPGIHLLDRPFCIVLFQVHPANGVDQQIDGVPPFKRIENVVFTQ